MDVLSKSLLMSLISDLEESFSLIPSFKEVRRSQPSFTKPVDQVNGNQELNHIPITLEAMQTPLSMIQIGSQIPGSTPKDKIEKRLESKSPQTNNKEESKYIRIHILKQNLFIINSKEK